jgi:hypothetical protein
MTPEQMRGPKGRPAYACPARSEPAGFSMSVVTGAIQAGKIEVDEKGGVIGDPGRSLDV